MQDDVNAEPVTPQDVLAAGQDTTVINGKEVCNGSVAAFVANARAFETMNADDPTRAATLTQLEELLPALEAVGVFDVFSLRSPALSEALRIDSGPSPTS